MGVEGLASGGRRSLYHRATCEAGRAEHEHAITRVEERLAEELLEHFGPRSGDDVVRGNVSIKSEEVDDKVLLKADGMPTYHLANVVDDDLRGISGLISFRFGRF